jgi:dienelactone hydrolase
MLQRALGWLLAFACASVAAQSKVNVPSLDQHDGSAVSLPAYWFAAERGDHDGPRTAVVLLHGCGGPFDGKGRLGQRLIDYAALLNAEGWHALVVDSLTPRGEKELCTQRTGTRRVTQANRRLDALGALQWLAAQPGVDAKRLALLGWSNGGSTALAASNRLQQDVARAAVTPRAAVAFYPGCEAELARRYAAVGSTLLLIGEKDDWTPAAPCVELAAAPGSGLRTVVYPGAYHGFDGSAPLRVRKDVPNGVRPGQGVTVGGDPAARDAARAEMLAFLREQLR